MLSKALGNGVQAGAPAPRPDLERQLFPSSSPRNSNIVDQFNKSSSRPLTVGASSSGLSTAPTKHKPANIVRSLSQRNYSQNFGSLVNKSGSFDDVEVVLPPTNGADIEHVYYTADDFEDDFDADLELNMPDTLPPLPPLSARKVPERLAVAPARDLTSQLSWSSSPASHVLPGQPPPPASGTSSQIRSQKRSSAEEATLLPKRRKLPQSYKEEVNEDKDAFAPAVHSTAARARPGSKQPWDVSERMIREQKKQFKSQNRKPDVAQHEATVKSEAAKKADSSIITLSAEQKRIQDLVVNKNQSIFFTGPAGTGKSVLMRSIIAELKKKWAKSPSKLAVTASTGLAACNIGGMTLHSFAGIGLGKEEVPKLVQKIRRNQKARQRWMDTRTLIIDEVSMVDGELFDKLSQIGRLLRNNGRPWGGIQLVITGDFFQLPPVPDHGANREVKFAFDASTWETSIEHTIGLTTVFRQKDPGQ